MSGVVSTTDCWTERQFGAAGLRSRSLDRELGIRRAPALESAGLPHRGPYAMRHTFASFAIAAGVSLFYLARLMGTSVE